MFIVPKRLLQSPLMRQGGLTVLRGMVGAAELEALRRESVASQALATEVSVPQSDAELIRGGNPARRFLSAPGGRVQSAFYGSAELQRAVAAVVGLPIAPTGAAGTFTYYCRPRDFLTIHRDIIACDVALITCLEDDGAQRSGGKLGVYPGRIWDSLPALRREPAKGAQTLRLMPGDTAVILGGILPHCTLPVEARQRRVVSLLCFRAQVD